MTYVHTATLMMDPAADSRAPGAAITLALCGALDHEPPCPLAPHHTDATRVGDEVHLRVLFAADAGQEPAVRELIDTALASGEARAADGTATHWRLARSGRDEVADAEVPQGARLATG